MPVNTSPRAGCSLLALLALPVVLALGARGPSSSPVDGAAIAASVCAPEAVAPAASAVAPAPASDPITGVWHRFAAHSEGDRIRFYYFHGDGHGLYRYGKVGLTNTHAFDYEVVGDRLRLRFRKTGEEHGIGFRVEADPEVPGRSWLVLADDPREAGGARYFRDEGARAAACADGATAAAAGRGIGNRLWSDERRFATGGLGFAMYQLQVQTIDGRGVGWFHRGDYDQWTTEALTYRRQGDVLTLHFMLRGDSQSSAITITEGAGEDARTLELADDPRDFWRSHVYRDVGPSFAGADALGGGPWPWPCE